MFISFQRYMKAEAVKPAPGRLYAVSEDSKGMEELNQRRVDLLRSFLLYVETGAVDENLTLQVRYRGRHRLRAGFAGGTIDQVVLGAGNELIQETTYITAD